MTEEGAASLATNATMAAEEEEFMMGACHDTLAKVRDRALGAKDMPESEVLSLISSV